MTRTCEPSGASSTPGGIIASPFARDTVEIRFEPRAPVGVAFHPSDPRATTTRAYCIFPLGPATSWVRRAVISGLDTCERPIIFSSAGRTNSSKLTNTLTGFPGNPK